MKLWLTCRRCRSDLTKDTDSRRRHCSWCRHAYPPIWENRDFEPDQSMPLSEEPTQTEPGTILRHAILKRRLNLFQSLIHPRDKSDRPGLVPSIREVPDWEQDEVEVFEESETVRRKFQERIARFWDGVREGRPVGGPFAEEIGS